METLLPGISVIAVIMLIFIAICLVIIIQLVLIRIFLFVRPIRHLAQEIFHVLEDYD